MPILRGLSRRLKRGSKAGPTTPDVTEFGLPPTSPTSIRLVGGVELGGGDPQTLERERLIAERERQLGERERAIAAREAAIATREGTIAQRESLSNAPPLHAASAPPPIVAVPMADGAAQAEAIAGEFITGEVDAAGVTVVGVALSAAETNRLRERELRNARRVNSSRDFRRDFATMSTALGEGPDLPSTCWRRGGVVRVVHEMLRSKLDLAFPQLPPMAPPLVPVGRRMATVLLDHLSDPAGGGTEDAEAAGALHVLAALIDPDDAGLSLDELMDKLDAISTLMLVVLAKEGGNDGGSASIRVAMGTSARARQRAARAAGEPTLMLYGPEEKRTAWLRALTVLHGPAPPTTRVCATVASLTELPTATFRAIAASLLEALGSEEVEAFLTNWLASGPFYSFRWRRRAASAARVAGTAGAASAGGAGGGAAGAEGGGGADTGGSVAEGDLTSSRISRAEVRELVSSALNLPIVGIILKQVMMQRAALAQVAMPTADGPTNNAVGGLRTWLEKTKKTLAKGWKRTWWRTCVRLAGLSHAGVDAPTFLGAAIAPIREAMANHLATPEEQARGLESLLHPQLRAQLPSRSPVRADRDAGWRERMRAVGSECLGSVRASLSAHAPFLARNLFEFADLDKDGRVSSSELDRLQVQLAALARLLPPVLPRSLGMSVIA